MSERGGLLPPFRETEEMGIRKSDFGELDGRTVEAHERDAGALRARVIPYGSVLSELHVPDGAGNSADTYGEHAGFALETQIHPDSPDEPHFPSAMLRPGELYRHVMRVPFFNASPTGGFTRDGHAQ